MGDGVEASTSLLVNGDPVVHHGEADEPLLYVLRNDLGLRGTRFGCGTGACGACTVLVDGRSVASCTTPMWSVEGAEVTTVEALAADGDAVVEAFVEAGAGQCAYCVPGIVMTVRGALDAHPDLTEDELWRHLDERNLCRCGAHVRMRRAVLSLLGDER